MRSFIFTYNVVDKIIKSYKAPFRGGNIFKRQTCFGDNLLFVIVVDANRMSAPYISQNAFLSTLQGTWPNMLLPTVVGGGGENNHRLSPHILVEQMSLPVSVFSARRRALRDFTVEQRFTFLNIITDQKHILNIKLCMWTKDWTSLACSLVNEAMSCRCGNGPRAGVTRLM